MWQVAAASTYYFWQAQEWSYPIALVGYKSGAVFVVEVMWIVKCHDQALTYDKTFVNQSIDRISAITLVRV